MKGPTIERMWEAQIALDNSESGTEFGGYGREYWCRRDGERRVNMIRTYCMKFSDN